MEPRGAAEAAGEERALAEAWALVARAVANVRGAVASMQRKMERVHDGVRRVAVDLQRQDDRVLALVERMRAAEGRLGHGAPEARDEGRDVAEKKTTGGGDRAPRQGAASDAGANAGAHCAPKEMAESANISEKKNRREKASTEERCDCTQRYSAASDSDAKSTEFSQPNRQPVHKLTSKKNIAQRENSGRGRKCSLRLPSNADTNPDEDHMSKKSLENYNISGEENKQGEDSVHERANSTRRQRVISDAKPPEDILLKRNPIYKIISRNQPKQMENLEAGKGYSHQFNSNSDTSPPAGCRSKRRLKNENICEKNTKENDDSLQKRGTCTQRHIAASDSDLKSSKNFLLKRKPVDKIISTTQVRQLENLGEGKEGNLQLAYNSETNAAEGSLKKGRGENEIVSKKKTKQDGGSMHKRGIFYESHVASSDSEAKPSEDSVLKGNPEHENISKRTMQRENYGCGRNDSIRENGVFSDSESDKNEDHIQKRQSEEKCISNKSRNMQCSLERGLMCASRSSIVWDATDNLAQDYRPKDRLQHEITSKTSGSRNDLVKRKINCNRKYREVSDRDGIATEVNLPKERTESVSISMKNAKQILHSEGRSVKCATEYGAVSDSRATSDENCSMQGQIKHELMSKKKTRRSDYSVKQRLKRNQRCSVVSDSEVNADEEFQANERIGLDATSKKKYRLTQCCVRRRLNSNQENGAIINLASISTVDCLTEKKQGGGPKNKLASNEISNTSKDYMEQNLHNCRTHDIVADSKIKQDEDCFQKKQLVHGVTFSKKSKLIGVVERLLNSPRKHITFEDSNVDQSDNYFPKGKLEFNQEHKDIIKKISNLTESAMIGTLKHSQAQGFMVTDVSSKSPKERMQELNLNSNSGEKVNFTSKSNLTDDTERRKFNCARGKEISGTMHKLSKGPNTHPTENCFRWSVYNPKEVDIPDNKSKPKSESVKQVCNGTQGQGVVGDMNTNSTEDRENRRVNHPSDITKSKGSFHNNERKLNFSRETVICPVWRLRSPKENTVTVNNVQPSGGKPNQITDRQQEKFIVAWENDMSPARELRYRQKRRLDTFKKCSPDEVCTIQNVTALNYNESSNNVPTMTNEDVEEKLNHFCERKESSVRKSTSSTDGVKSKFKNARKHDFFSVMKSRQTKDCENGSANKAKYIHSQEQNLSSCYEQTSGKTSSCPILSTSDSSLSIRDHESSSSVRLIQPPPTPTSPGKCDMPGNCASPNLKTFAGTLAANSVSAITEASASSSASTLSSSSGTSATAIPTSVVSSSAVRNPCTTHYHNTPIRTPFRRPPHQSAHSSRSAFSSTTYRVHNPFVRPISCPVSLHSKDGVSASYDSPAFESRIVPRPSSRNRAAIPLSVSYGREKLPSTVSNATSFSSTSSTNSRGEGSVSRLSITTTACNSSTSSPHNRKHTIKIVPQRNSDTCFYKASFPNRDPNRRIRVSSGTTRSPWPPCGKLSSESSHTLSQKFTTRSSPHFCVRKTSESAYSQCPEERSYSLPQVCKSFHRTTLDRASTKYINRQLMTGVRESNFRSNSQILSPEKTVSTNLRVPKSVSQPLSQPACSKYVTCPFCALDFQTTMFPSTVGLKDQISTVRFSSPPVHRSISRSTCGKSHSSIRIPPSSGVRNPKSGSTSGIGSANGTIRSLSISRIQKNTSRSSGVECTNDATDSSVSHYRKYVLNSKYGIDNRKSRARVLATDISDVRIGPHQSYLAKTLPGTRRVPLLRASEMFTSQERRLKLGKRLLKAAQEGDNKLVRQLLAEGANVNFTIATKWTALHRAVRMGHGDVVTTLLERGADVCAKTSYNFTALHIAAYYDFSGKLIGQLVRAGSDVDSRNRSGKTPLHYASEVGNLVGTRTLLKAGATAKSLDNQGRSPCELAKTNKIREILGSLRRKQK